MSQGSQVSFKRGADVSPGTPDTVTNQICLRRWQVLEGVRRTQRSPRSPLFRVQAELSEPPLCPPLPCLQSRLQTQLKALKIEMDQAKVRGTEMGLENGLLTGGLGGGAGDESEGGRGHR